MPLFVPLSYIFLAFRTPELSTFGVQWRTVTVVSETPKCQYRGVQWQQGIEISASILTDHFISTSLQTTFSIGPTVGLLCNVTQTMTQPNCEGLNRLIISFVACSKVTIASQCIKEMNAICHVTLPKWDAIIDKLHKFRYIYRWNVLLSWRSEPLRFASDCD